MLTQEQKRLVKSSFDSLLPVSEKAAGLFYNKLFELDPSLRPMFMSDMSGQGRKFVNMLRIAVANLDSLEQVMPAVEAMGRRHAGYGIEKRHYETFGAALLWAVDSCCGSHASESTREAWKALYECITGAMQQAAEEECILAQGDNFVLIAV